jgi:hypothetical protein
MPIPAGTMLYLKDRKQSLVLDDVHKVAEGGEGAVYRIPGDANSVAKVYFDPKATRSLKLRKMLADPPRDPMAPQSISIAWPTELVVDRAGHIRGFAMPFARGMKSIFSAYHPGARTKAFPFFDHRFPYYAGANLATAMQAIHVSGYTFGDVNANNVLVNAKALVTAIDTDSFQVPDGRGSYHRCLVGVPDFTPPEMHGVEFKAMDRSPEQDAFGLACLLFLLLMEGNHPYDGIYRGSGEAPTLAERIPLGYFPHAGLPGCPVVARPLAPAFSILEPGLRQLFLQCFVDGHHSPSRRPTAEQWKVALRNAQAALVPCPDQPRHVFSSHLRGCPWCEFDARVHGRAPKKSGRISGPNHAAGLQVALPALVTPPRSTPPAVAPLARPAPPPIPPPPLPQAIQTPGVRDACPGCGEANQTRTRFCLNCGTPLSIHLSMPVHPPQPPQPPPSPSGFKRAAKWILILTGAPLAMLAGLLLIGTLLGHKTPAESLASQSAKAPSDPALVSDPPKAEAPSTPAIDGTVLFANGWDFPFDGVNLDQIGEAATQRCEERQNPQEPGNPVEYCRYEYAGLWLSQTTTRLEGQPPRVLLHELEISGAQWPVKLGLNPGTTADRIRQILGAPQKVEASTWRYEDAAKNAVIFTIAVDRISKVRWERRLD